MRNEEKRKITVEDLDFLRDLQFELNTQDTCGNRDPRFWTVQDSVFEPTWSENAEYYLIVDDEGEEVGRVNYEIDAGDLDCVPMHERRAVVEDTLFLTLRECREHIERNRHHYKRPRTYAQTAWRSPQFERLISILQQVDWNVIRGVL